MNIPRYEHPKPQFERADWLNLNGEWDFEFDFGNSKKDAGIIDKKEWDSKIIVPFCPESKLSGIEYTDFIPAVWYRKTVNITADHLKGRVILHFGAVDYDSTIYINGKTAGNHKGGYASFKFDITEYLCEGENTIIVNAVDDVRSNFVPRGKQCEELKSRGCDYTRTTGIWQTVWLEFVPVSYIKSFKIFPDYINGSVTISAVVEGNGEFTASASYEGKKMGSFTKNAKSTVTGEIKLDEIHLWEVGCGRLYDLELTFGKDKVKSYFGLRNVELDDYKFLINGKSVFQRLVLDQGFYSEGIYTAPTDKDLENDIKISLAVGFNGARLHQKVLKKDSSIIATGLATSYGVNTATGVLTIQTLPHSVLCCPNGANVLKEISTILQSSVGAPSTKHGILQAEDRTTMLFQQSIKLQSIWMKPVPALIPAVTSIQ